MSEALGFPRDTGLDALSRLRHSLDEAITAPSFDHEAWVYQLGAVLARLGRIFGRHVTETEAPDGSLEDVVQLKPHLQPSVHRIMDEHVSLRSHIDQLLCAVKICSATDATVDDLRVEAGHLAKAIKRHQAKGVDLVYEAYLREEGVGH